jgi:hypothetical protein
MDLIGQQIGLFPPLQLNGYRNHDMETIAWLKQGVKRARMVVHDKRWYDIL